MDVQECYRNQFSGQPAFFYISQTPVLSDRDFYNNKFLTYVSLICLSRVAAKSQCFKQAHCTEWEVPIESLMGPFTEYGHVVQKTPCWMALGQENQRERFAYFKKLVSFLFKVLLHCSSSSKVFMVPYECILQRVHCAYILGTNDQFFTFTSYNK